MPAGAQSVQWVSNVARAPALKFESPQGAPWVEVWRIEAGPIWHVDYSGTPQVFADDSGEPSPVQQFEPRAGEALELAITRPRASKARRLRSSRVDQQVQVGHRATDRLTLVLPQHAGRSPRRQACRTGARLQHAQADGQPITLDPRDGESHCRCNPASTRSMLAWQTDAGARLTTRHPRSICARRRAT
jgi:hypothetical protein